MDVMDQAMEIAESESHKFMSVKFLGPGELIMNPQLFQIIEEYQKRGITISIFTKAALLGDDELAVRYQGHAGVTSAKDFVDRLASYDNVNLLVSFQSFEPALQDAMVRTPVGYTEIRNRALTYLFASKFYKDDGTTERMCALNAPITPENIDESLEIYKFFIERGTPVIMTPTMVSGKGKDQLKEQQETCTQEEFQERLIELYSEIYLYNILKGIQTLEEIEKEGIASYVGADPCNQASVGLYLRANGTVQMCPGRFDCSTIFGNVRTRRLSEIWMASPNRQRGLQGSQNLVNNRCPAKDASCPEEDSERSFSFGFYGKVKDALMKKLLSHFTYW
ncbi:MAG: radical SAM protein, partial [bacterium]|nr:radical SAM protein [bacterium]